MDNAHRRACGERLRRLLQQRADLGACCDEQAGRADFKVCRQFKMCDDPRSNPVLGAESK